MVDKFIRGLRELSLLADEALANRILEAERLKSAELRLRMIEREDSRHMCLTPGCRNPVVGKWVFGHCMSHLEPYERRWLEEKIESPQPDPPPKDESEHPIVRKAKEVIEARDIVLAKEIALKKKKALADARELLDKVRGLELERRAFLPEKLRRRIDYIKSEQLEEVGWRLAIIKKNREIEHRSHGLCLNSSTTVQHLRVLAQPLQ
ncbi:MAG: hypothetical protein ACYDBH_11220 [Acidobacteriaceae bacterium]